MAEPRQVGTELARTGVAGDNPAGFAAYAGKARSWFTAMHPARRSQLIAAVLLIGATIAALGWYANRPDWRLLYSGLESKDVQQVAQELSAANIVDELMAVALNLGEESTVS